MKDPMQTTNVMRSQLSRLYGQLYALQNKFQDALQVMPLLMLLLVLLHPKDDRHLSSGTRDPIPWPVN